ncbi:MAG: flagellar hook-associated protein FlgK [Lachnospiraceae bacterium]|nr:flagellar hook-associated protein FlgK [Lachnospiraceae bacterium]
MASTFFGLDIAYKGLTAANAALNTTANNIANVQTEGYSRQVVNQKASDPLRSYTTYGTLGSGVDTVSIDRQRDQFYDYKMWKNNTKCGEYEEKAYYMKQIEDLFTDDSTIKGFNTIFNEMYSSLAELQKNAGDTTTKAQFIGYANNLAYYFNTIASQLSTIQLDANAEIKNKVDELNSYAEEIASLNEQINVIEMTGAAANELRDQRDLIIDKLSMIVDVEFTETPVYDTNQPDRDTGASRCTIRIAGGQWLVDGSEYRQLECVARAENKANNQSDALGLFDLSWKNDEDTRIEGYRTQYVQGKITDAQLQTLRDNRQLTDDDYKYIIGEQERYRETFDLSSLRIGGELQGLIAIRDGNNGENFRGTVSAIGEAASGKKTMTIDVTKDYLQDINKLTLPDEGGVLEVGSLRYSYDSFQIVMGADGKVSQYIFELSDMNAKDPTADRIGMEAEVGDVLEYQGVPYYQQQINEWCRTYAEVFNKILAHEGYSDSEKAVDGHGNETDAVLFVANEATSDAQRYFKDSRSATSGSTIDSNSDSYYFLTAQNFAVNSEMMEDPQLMASHTGKGKGGEAYNIIKELNDLRGNKEKMTFRGCTAGEFLQNILSDISLNANNANTFHNSYTNIGRVIDTQRLSISGVDTDEESLNLVEYQHAYNLASKMIQVLTEVYDRLITQTGV